MRLDDLSLKRLGDTAYCYHCPPNPKNTRELQSHLAKLGTTPVTYSFTSFILSSQSEKIIPNWTLAISYLVTDIRSQEKEGRKIVAVLTGPTEGIPVFILGLILEDLMKLCCGVVILGHMPRCMNEDEGTDYIWKNGIPLEILT